jgi:hypothetical protein
MTALRYHVDPRDAPAHVAARRIGLTEAQFTEALPQLSARGFPHPDPTTGLFDLDAIDEWRRRRHPQLFHTATELARDAKAVVRTRLEALRNG